MSKETYIIKPNMDGYKLFMDRLSTCLKLGKPATVDFEEGERKKRTLSANALQHVWIREIAEFEGKSEEEVECELKRDVGLPILLGEGNDLAMQIRYTLDKIRYNYMTLEQQAKVMKLMAVTSLMSTKQHTRYRDLVQLKYANEGLVLEVR